MTLQENLDSLKNKKMPSATTFGKLQGIVPVPYAKFVNMDNPRPKYKDPFVVYRPQNIDREFSANTRTKEASKITVDDLNFQAFRPE